MVEKFWRKKVYRIDTNANEMHLNGHLNGHTIAADSLRSQQQKKSS